MIAPFLIVIFSVVLVTAALYSAPALSRRPLLFGVAVDIHFRESDAARRLIRRYHAATLIAGVTGLALAAAGALAGLVPLLALGPVVVTLGAIMSWVAANRAARAHHAPLPPVREAALEVRQPPFPFALLLYFGALAIVAAGALYVAAHWAEIPQRFVIHWTASGVPNGWMTKRPLGIYCWFLLAAGLVLVMLLTGWAALYRARAPEATRRHVFWVTVVVAYVMAALFSWIGAWVPFIRAAPRFPAWILVPLMALEALLVAFSVHYGVKLAAAPGPAPVEPDAGYAGGLFYYNPADPALMVEKRFGVGLDVNFAHPLAWLIPALILGLVGLMFAAALTADR
jgi:uncharacterized membrane protein